MRKRVHGIGCAKRVKISKSISLEGRRQQLLVHGMLLLLMPQNKQWINSLINSYQEENICKGVLERQLFNIEQAVVIKYQNYISR